MAEIEEIERLAILEEERKLREARKRLETARLEEKRTAREEKSRLLRENLAIVETEAVRYLYRCI